MSFVFVQILAFCDSEIKSRPLKIDSLEAEQKWVAAQDFCTLLHMDCFWKIVNSYVLF